MSITWVNGTKDLATGFRQTEAGLKAFGKSSARSDIDKAEKSVHAGEALIIKGDKLLGVKASRSSTT